MASVATLPRDVLPAKGARVLIAVLTVLALVVGALSTVKPMYAVAIVGAAVVVLVVLRNASSLAYFLVFTMFVESVSLGSGLRIGRVFGALALLVLALTLLTRGRSGLKPSALLVVTGGYGLWILASGLWAWSPSAVAGVASSYVLAICYTLSFAVLIRTREQLFGVAKVLAVGSAIFGAVAFAYYARHAGAGGSAASINDVSNRAAGLQGDPNYFALYQVVAMPAALVLAAHTRRLLYYAVVGLIVISVISSLSRSGLLALTIATLLVLALPWRIFFNAGKQKMTFLISVVAGAGAAAALGSTAIVARVQTIINPNAQGSYRGAGRQDLWNAALHGWRMTNRLLGMGAGNFDTYSLDLLQSTPGVDTTQRYVAAGREVHSAYLQNLTDLGAIGLGLFLLVLALTARSLVRSFRRARAAGDLDLQRFSLAFVVSLAAYALSALFLSIELAKVLWILVGLTLALDVVTRRLAVVVPASEPAYDDAMRRLSVEELEGELQAMQQRLVADQERLDRRRAALDERERELTQRQPAAEPSAPPTAVLAKLLRSRDRTIEGLRAELAQLQQLVASPVREPVRVREAPPAAPAPPPPAAPAPVPGPHALELEPIRGRWNLSALEAAAARYPDDPHAEEWLTYAAFLRDHVDLSGLLPASFDPLVDEVYGELIARVRE